MDISAGRVSILDPHSSENPITSVKITNGLEAGNVTVNPATMEVDIDGEVVKADVCNVIPAQKAGLICAAAGLTELYRRAMDES